MRQTVITVESDNGLHELCVGVYDGDTRLGHDDYVLNREELWNLKQQVDKAWFNKSGDEVAEDLT